MVAALVEGQGGRGRPPPVRQQARADDTVGAARIASADPGQHFAAGIVQQQHGRIFLRLQSGEQTALQVCVEQADDALTALLQHALRQMRGEAVAR